MAISPLPRILGSDPGTGSPAGAEPWSPLHLACCQDQCPLFRTRAWGPRGCTATEHIACVGVSGRTEGCSVSKSIHFHLFSGRTLRELTFTTICTAGPRVPQSVHIYHSYRSTETPGSNRPKHNKRTLPVSARVRFGNWKVENLFHRNSEKPPEVREATQRLVTACTGHHTQVLPDPGGGSFSGSWDCAHEQGQVVPCHLALNGDLGT